MGPPTVTYYICCFTGLSFAHRDVTTVEVFGTFIPSIVSPNRLLILEDKKAEFSMSTSILVNDYL
uniref:Putative ovule protein n=1 Tax=Solanum chacoense TaxID=4108 RepID=A0A0V0GHS3_SOLCH